MKFAAGYQTPRNGERFSDMIADYAPDIDEVYFSWPGLASGRPDTGSGDWGAQQRLERELSALGRAGVKADLLFNGNCYGEDAVSEALRTRVLGLLEYLGLNGCFPQIVTTASPFIAHVIRTEYPSIELRASVNMRVGTLQAMEYLADTFDSFYLQRDYQRNLDYVRTVRAWCDRNGKKLCLLANSGCLRFCPAQTFHDNLIAHSAGAEARRNPDWNPHLCRSVTQKPSGAVSILKSTWIRPEDLSHYEGLIDIVKLATRQHSHPRMVLGAYTSGRFDGNLLELLEPGFASQFFPQYIDNTAFPADWFEKSGRCLMGCTGCGYCEAVLSQVLRRYGEEPFPQGFPGI